MSTYVVGDIQGCYDELQLLLEKVDFDPDKDVLWSCGDMVNRGPKSLKTLRFCKSLGSAFWGVLGNHDLHLLAVARGHRKTRSADTFEKILTAPDREELLGWIRTLPLFHYDAEHNVALVHAGVPPTWGLKKCLELSEEISQTLLSDQCDLFLQNMYGNDPASWDKSLQGPERWRCITNYFTRMRFCSPEGKLELKTTSGPKSAPKGYAPWYQHKSKLMKKVPILFGHWAALMGQTDNNQAIALDTGCAWGGTLTLCELNSDFPRTSVKTLKSTTKASK
ncbi:MAG: symmetrical bis(5'-nucleosyl)-tetraphosphatase [Porticoccaceae bacterium]|jgi:bis(5'-nucleosyl)-tetraphosphatase (symmetrical)|nr:symmetrical bis(5'-nucleosyl)-tetraphosphatase [Porticoccaceae bacterium]